MREGLRNRIRLLYLFVFAFALVAFVRLFYLQVIHGADYRVLADRQYSRPITDLFNRGSIYFTEKNGTPLAAATLKETYFFALNPKLVENPVLLCSQIIVALPRIDGAECLLKASKQNDPYELLGRGFTEEEAEKIESLEHPGAAMYKENNRIYPAGSLAAHVVGFVGHSEETGPFPVGRYGIEKQYDTLLSRSFDGVHTNFFAELFGDIKEGIAGELEGEGDVVLSLEPTVQDYFEKQLVAVREKWSADSAGGVIIEPKTGRIVAMASVPTYNPNSFSQETTAAVFSNPLVEGVYELGSIMKPLTMAAGIDAGVVKRTTMYDDKGFLEISGKTIKNFDGKARGVVSMQEVLNQSLNTGSVYVMQKIGKENFSTYMRAFGFGEKTEITLPNEQRGLTKNLDSPYEVDRATVSFGQGLAITPIQMVRALSTLANGGVLMKPYVVDALEYKSGLVKKTSPQSQGRILKAKTAETISAMLAEVVDTKLAGGKAKMEHYTIAAKTGTAQIANPSTSKYYEDRYLHSFFGYLPNQEKNYLVFLYMVYPKNVQYSAETLTDPFLKVINYLIQYYNIPPDR